MFTDPIRISPAQVSSQWTINFCQDEGSVFYVVLSMFWGNGYSHLSLFNKCDFYWLFFRESNFLIFFNVLFYKCFALLGRNWYFKPVSLRKMLARWTRHSWATTSDLFNHCTHAKSLDHVSATELLHSDYYGALLARCYWRAISW